MDLASEDRHLVAQHDDLDGEIRVAATDQSDELQDAAERPVEEREGHRWMLAAPDSRRQSAVRRHGWHSRHPQVGLSSPYHLPGTFSRRMADRSGRVGWALDVVCAHLTLGGVAFVE